MRSTNLPEVPGCRAAIASIEAMIPISGSVQRYNRAAQIRAFSGARGVRIVDGRGALVEAHAHDWPVISLYLLGGYTNESEAGTMAVSGPSAMYYGARAAHANRVGNHGLEQVDIEFDPAWLGPGALLPGQAVRCWAGGTVGAAARRLALAWTDERVGEAMLSRALRNFLAQAATAQDPGHPDWYAKVEAMLDEDSPPTTALMAERIGVSGRWLAERYRAAAGEGIGQAVRRRRVQLATAMLRHSNLGAADIAAAAGFCDQAHMVRCLRADIGRTPSQVRSGWSRQQGAAALGQTAAA